VVEVIGQTAGLLHRRFLLNAVLPVVVLTVVSAAVVDAVRGLDDVFDAYDEQSGDIRALQLVGMAAGILVLAAVLSSQTSRLIRFYEGYWSWRPLGWAAAVGRGWHRARLADLAARTAVDPAAYDRIYRRYPLPTQPEQVMPTRLGNTLKNAETYPMDRYGIDAVVVWPRLFPLIPDRHVADLAGSRADLELLVVLSCLAASFAVGAGGYVLAADGARSLFLLCVWGGAAVAWATYRGAISAAAGYGEQVKVAFDLYRRDLLAQVAPAGSADGDDEIAQWQQLALRWYRNTPGATELARPVVPSPAVRSARLPLSGWLALAVLLAGAVGAVVLA
jgi:hypothetical protein